ncbi:MAG: ABC transporter substrate-binding protein [Cyanobacteria bacterium J06639_1]
MVNARFQRLRSLIPLVGLGSLAIACTPSPDTSRPPTVTILGSITGDGQTTIEQVMQPFTDATGIEVIYEGTANFATLLPVRATAGNPPDLALFPQPGLMADLARQGELVPLTELIERSQLETAFAQTWLDLGTVDGELYGLWSRADVKSLVWYRPDVFEAEGYAVPTTWDEMMALSDRLISEGKTPWCLGIESGAASGWVGTDWIEDIVLREGGTDIYDRWVARDIPFTHPVIKTSFERFGAIARSSDYALGGAIGVISTPFGDSPQPLFSNPPGCYLHRQANFISTFFPEDVEVGTDVAIFPLPSIEPDSDAPLLIAGTVFAALSDSPETRALVEYLTTVEPHQRWVESENYISPHQSITPDSYTNPLLSQQAELLANATSIRFDASDLMPGAVGTGTFWSGVVDYVGGADLDGVLQAIDTSWPENE